MKFWLDAQLPPALARYLTETFGVEAHVVRNLGLRDAADRETHNSANHPVRRIMRVRSRN